MSTDSLMVYPHFGNTKGEFRTLKAIHTPISSDVGCFAGCFYGQQLWFGLVKDYDAQYDDYINFL